MRFFGDTKSVSPAVSAFFNGTDVMEDGSNGAKITTPYAQSSWVYIAINRLAKKVSSIPFRISRVGSGNAKRIRALRSSSDPRHCRFITKALGETIIESGDVVDLFNRPHPTMNRQLFWEMVVTWNCLRGEFFIMPLDGADGTVDLTERNPRVERLLTVPTELFWHIVQGYDLKAWRYTGSPLLTPLPSEILSPGEIIHSRTPNPYLYWRGMSPLFLAMGPAGADYAASQYAKGYWMNNADTGVIVTTEQQCAPDQREAILTALRERKRKAGTADRPLFLWGGAKVEKPQLSGMEQQFIENRKMNRQEIAAIYEVPDSIMGFSEAKASALSGGGDAIQQEQIGFLENTICPLCCHIEAAIEPVIKTFGEDLIGWFDVDSQPAMQAARRARVDTAAKAFAIGASFNDVNTVYDLGFEKKPWGDLSYLPFNLQQVGETPEPLPSETEPDGDEAKSNPFSAMRSLLSGIKTTPQVRKPSVDVVNLWKAHITARRAAVKMFEGKIGKVVMRFRTSTLAKLNEIHLEKSAGRMGEIKSLIDLIFHATSFGKALNTELETPLRSTLQSAGDQMRAELGQDDPWKYPPQAVQEFLASRTQKIAGVGDTLRNQLNTALTDGMEAGETTDELAARLKGVFNEFTDGGARRVAQTEVNTAYNTARHEAMTDAGIEYKSWLSSHGPHVRPAHAEAEEVYLNEPIPLDEPFDVGGDQMMFPGDDSLGADVSNIINCQCIQLAAQKQSEDDKSATYKIFGAGTMTFDRQGTK